MADHFKRCKKKTKLDGNANPAIENSVIKVIEKDKPESTGENKLSLTETCSSLLDIHSWNLDIGITIKNKCVGIIIKNKCNLCGDLE